MLVNLHRFFAENISWALEKASRIQCRFVRIGYRRAVSACIGSTVSVSRKGAKQNDIVRVIPARSERLEPPNHFEFTRVRKGHSKPMVLIYRLKRLRNNGKDPFYQSNRISANKATTGTVAAVNECKSKPTVTKVTMAPSAGSRSHHHHHPRSASANSHAHKGSGTRSASAAASRRATRLSITHDFVYQRRLLA